MRGVVAASTLMTREVESASGLPGQGGCTVCAAADWAANNKNAGKANFSMDIGLIWRGTAAAERDIGLFAARQRRSNIHRRQGAGLSAAVTGRLPVLLRGLR